MSVKTYIDSCVSPIQRIQEFRAINMQSYADFNSLRELFLLFSNSDLMTDDVSLQSAVADEARKLINQIYNEGQSHIYTAVVPNGDVLSLKAVVDDVRSILYSVTGDGTIQEICTVNAGPFTAEVPPIEIGNLEEILLFTDERAGKRYTDVANLLYQVDIKQQLSEVVDTVLDLSIKTETKASDVYTVLNSKFTDLYSTSREFITGIVENASFLDKNTVLPFMEGLLRSVSGSRVSEDGTKIILEDTNYSNKAWLGTVLKQAIASLAVAVSAAIAYVVSPVLGAVVAGVGSAISFISNRVMETTSPRIHWDAPLYDYAMTLFTTSVENQTFYNKFKESYQHTGLAMNAIGNVYILTTPIFNKDHQITDMRYQCSLNLAYCPIISFEQGTASGNESFKGIRSALVRVEVADVDFTSNVSVTCKGWDSLHGNESNYSHSIYYDPARIITQSVVNDDIILTDLAAGLSESLSVLTQSYIDNITVTMTAKQFADKDFGGLNTDVKKAIAWMGYLATFASAPDHTIQVLRSGGLVNYKLNLTWSDINDTIIPLIRSIANDTSVPCSLFIINNSVTPVAVDPHLVLSDNGFIEPPVFSREQWLKTGLMVAAGAAVAAVVAVGAVKAKRAITQFRVKRYTAVQNAMKKYASTGSSEDLRAYTKAARKYNFLAKFIGGRRIDITTGWETGGDGSSVVSEVNSAFSKIQTALNDSGDTVATDSQTNEMLLKIKNLISLE